MKFECSLNIKTVYFNSKLKNYISVKSDLKNILINNLYNCLNNNYRIGKKIKEYVGYLLKFFSKSASNNIN